MRATLLFLLGGLLAAQDFSNVTVEKVSGGHRFTEGPVYSRDGYLLFSDVPNDLIVKLDASGKSNYRENSGGANGNTFDTGGRLYTAEGNNRRVTRTNRNGKVEVLAENYQGKKFNAPNDLVVRRDGHLYFTDPAFGSQAKNRELDYYGIYHLPPKGPLELVAKPAGRPNGIALSPDGKILYVANSDDKNVRAYDLDKDGKASNERVVVSNVPGTPDGMKTDEKGNLYVTGAGLHIYSPEGKPLFSLEMAEIPANCAWGGQDMQFLFVTARTSVYRVHLPVKGSVHY